MTNCADLFELFCTVEKCQELENRIASLEQTIALLEAALEAHTNQDIPEAHDYQPPEPEPPPEPEIFVTVDVFDLGDNNFAIKVGVNGDSDQDNFSINVPDISEPTQHIPSNLKGSATLTGDTLLISIADGESQDTFSVNLPYITPQDLPEPTQHVESNLKGSATLTGDTLLISIADGESQDTFSVNLPYITPQDLPPIEPLNLPVNIDLSVEGNTLNAAIDVGDYSDWATAELPKLQLPVNIDLSVEKNTLNAAIDVGDYSDWATAELPTFKPNVLVDVFEQEDNTATIKVTVNDDSDQDVLLLPSFNLDDMNCDDLEQLIIDSFNNLDNQLGNLDNHINLLEDSIKTDIKDVSDKVDIIDNAVNIELNDSISGNFNCSFPTVEEGTIINPLTTETETNTTAINYSGKTFYAINNALKIINNNIARTYSELCKLIEPQVEITKNEVYKLCSDTTINPESYQDPNAYQAAINDFLQSKLENTPYAALLNTNGSATANISRITNYLSYMTLKQTRVNNTDICTIAQNESQDVVSIVASPKYVTNFEGNVLILHFVTLDNYPKRQANSHYRAIQIPAAKESYDWDINFKDLRWQQGNQYAELSLVGYKSKVSGWFENIAQANSFFDAILSLTTATEYNRNFPNHSNPRTDISIQETRPYRAFISTVNNNGDASILDKYFPPQNDT